MLDQKINQDQSEGRCEIGDSGKIEKALHALARYLPLTFNWKLAIHSCTVMQLLQTTALPSLITSL